LVFELKINIGKFVTILTVF